MSAEIMVATPRVALDPRRAQNIGASEVPALFSLDWDAREKRPRETRFQLWVRKRRGVESPPEPELADPRSRLFWGTVLEPAIASGISQITRWRLRPGGFAEHKTVRGMSATPDYFVEPGAPELGNEAAALEIKAVDRAEFYSWAEVSEPGVFEWIDGEWIAARRQPPLRMKLQPQHQMAVAGLSVGVLGILVGGNDLHIVRIDRHEGVIGRIETEVERFWQSIDEGLRPPVDYALDVDTLAALLGETRPGSVADLRGNPEALELAIEFDRYRQVAKLAEAERSARKGRLLELVGDAERALFDDGYHLSAKWLPETFVPGYDRAAYHNFRLTAPKEK